jgi:hypothetical protein
VTLDCNECNEALDTARAVIAAARRLALVVQNALLNGDVRRAQAALRNLHDSANGEFTPNAASAPGSYRR